MPHVGMLVLGGGFFRSVVGGDGCACSRSKRSAPSWGEEGFCPGGSHVSETPRVSISVFLILLSAWTSSFFVPWDAVSVILRWALLFPLDTVLKMRLHQVRGFDTSLTFVMYRYHVFDSRGWLQGVWLGPQALAWCQAPGLWLESWQGPGTGPPARPAAPAPSRPPRPTPVVTLSPPRSRELPVLWSPTGGLPLSLRPEPSCPGGLWPRTAAVLLPSRPSAAPSLLPHVVTLRFSSFWLYLRPLALPARRRLHSWSPSLAGASARH